MGNLGFTIHLDVFKMKPFEAFFAYYRIPISFFAACWTVPFAGFLKERKLLVVYSVSSAKIIFS